MCERQARFLKRQLSLPVSMMSRWRVKRSSSALVILASTKMLGHSPKARLVVTMMEVRSELADQMEQQLTAGLGKSP
jgi:hypothetical protein